MAVASSRGPPPRYGLRTGLSMLAAGILVYCMVEIVGNTAGQVSTSWRDAASGRASARFGILVGAGDAGYRSDEGHAPRGQIRSESPGIIAPILAAVHPEPPQAADEPLEPHR